MYLNRFFVFLAFLISAPAFAQEFRKLDVQEYQKFWETGPLIAADFRGQETTPGATASHLSYKLGYFPEKIKRPDTTIYRFTAYSFMDRNTSWLSAEEKSAPSLAYYQALFNLVEVYERQLQTELYHLTRQEDADKLTTQQFEKLNQETAALAAQTRNGQDFEATKKYLSETESRLAAFPARSLPAFSDRNLSYGFHGGIGYTQVGGDLSDNFQNPFNLLLGADVGYNKLLLHLNFTHGFTEVEDSFTDTEERIWPFGTKANVNYFEGSLGYHLLNSGKFNLIPFAGWSFIKFEGSGRNEVFKYHELTQHTYNVGICLDYKLRHRFNFIPGYFGKLEASETRIRTRLSFSPLHFNDVQKGNIISISASLNFGGRMLKVN